MYSMIQLYIYIYIYIYLFIAGGARVPVLRLPAGPGLRGVALQGARIKCVYIYIYIHTCMYVYVYIYIYIYTHVW